VSGCVGNTKSARRSGKRSQVDGEHKQKELVCSAEIGVEEGSCALWQEESENRMHFREKDTARRGASADPKQTRRQSPC